MRRDRSASRMWFGCARFSTVLLNNTSNSSCSRLNSPVNGCSPVLITIPSLTHCQNCFCVVQNCLRSRQTTSAVFFLCFFFMVRYTSSVACRKRKALHTETPWGSLSCEAATNFQTGRRTPTPVACGIRRVFDSATIGSEFAELVLFVTLGNSL